MVFCNFLEIKAETKKVVGVKVVPFGVLYSCMKFRRLKMGDPVYKIQTRFYDRVNSKTAESTGSNFRIHILLSPLLVIYIYKIQTRFYDRVNSKTAESTGSNFCIHILLSPLLVIGYSYF